MVTNKKLRTLYFRSKIKILISATLFDQRISRASLANQFFQTVVNIRLSAVKLSCFEVVISVRLTILSVSVAFNVFRSLSFIHLSSYANDTNFGAFSIFLQNHFRKKTRGNSIIYELFTCLSCSEVQKFFLKIKETRRRWLKGK